MTRSIFFALALFLSCIALSEASCFRGCRFKFCDGVSTIRVGYPDRALTGPICLKNGVKVGIVNTGEALLLRGRPIRISRWHPRGLKQKFSPHFFKTFNVYKYKHGKRIAFSGVGHEVAQQNQAKFLNRKCWALPVKAYQVLNHKYEVIDNKHPRYSALYNCIAFKTIL